MRYDEAWNPAIADIGHAFRVTVRATNGYVYPASHRAGIDRGRVADGRAPSSQDERRRADPGAAHGRSQHAQDLPRDAEVRPDRRRQRSDMYITGTFDTRWNNDILNPRSHADRGRLRSHPARLEASRRSAPAHGGIAANPNLVVGGKPVDRRGDTDRAAPAGGAVGGAVEREHAVTVPAT